MRHWSEVLACSCGKRFRSAAAESVHRHSFPALCKPKRVKKEKVVEQKIVTRHIYPPIPIRRFDWSATRGDYDLGDLQGFGATEAEAIADLIDLEEDRRIMRGEPRQQKTPNVVNG